MGVSGEALSMPELALGPEILDFSALGRGTSAETTLLEGLANPRGLKY